jgi:predicted ATPase
VDHFEDGVYMVELAAVADPGMVLPTVARSLAVKEGGEQTIEDALLDYARVRKMMLLLDNFEQVLDAAPSVMRLMEGSPWLKVLVTSREALRVRGERRFPVPPLAVPSSWSSSSPAESGHALRSTGPLMNRSPWYDSPSVEQIGSYSSVQLFVESARAVRPDFHLTGENAASVASICVRLDGLPLAIELAAGHINIFSPQQLEARLAGSLQLLRSAERGLPARQRTLNTAIDWSYRLLGADEQALFRRLGVFVGGYTVEAAEQISAGLSVSVVEGLETLLNKSLITHSERGSSFRLGMLETIREYALGQLAAHGEEVEARQRHARYYVSMGLEAAPHLNGAEQAIWLERVEAEHDNIRSALQWLLDSDLWVSEEPAGAKKRAQERIELGAQLCIALHRFWSLRAYYSEARTWFNKAAERIRALIDPSYLPSHRPGVYSSLDLRTASQTSRALASLFGSVLAGAGTFAYELSDFEEAHVLHEAGLSVRRQIDDKEGIASSLGNLGNLAGSLGDYEAAKRYLAESLTLRQELGNYILIASSLNDLGIVECNTGNFERARSLYEEALAIAERLGNRDHMGRVLNNLGIVLRYQGNFAEAQRSLERALQLQTELGKWHSNGLSFANMALVARDEGRYNEARRYFLESLAIVSEAEDKWTIAECLEGLASLAAVAGDAIRAAMLFGAAEALREAIRGPLVPVERAYQERYMALARQQVSLEEWRAAWEKGRANPLGDIMGQLLAGG